MEGAFIDCVKDDRMVIIVHPDMYKNAIELYPCADVVVKHDLVNPNDWFIAMNDTAKAD